MKPIFEGVCTALITPMKKNKIDYDSFAKLIEHNINGGVDALLTLGTTGEPSTMTDKEKKRVVEFVIKQVNGRVPVIVGIGGNNPTKMIKEGNFAKACGAAAVLASNPYYNKATQNGMYKFFDFIAKNVDMPIIAYNVPGRTGQNIAPETLKKLCEIPQIAGIKEASGDINQICAVVSTCNVPVYSGDDGLTLPILSIGGVGVISVASNILPKEVKELVSTKSVKIHNKYFKLFKELFCEVNPIPVKFLSKVMGLTTGELRLPLTQIEPHNAEKLERIYRESL